jgi:hypothetical protein
MKTKMVLVFTDCFRSFSPLVPAFTLAWVHSPGVRARGGSKGPPSPSDLVPPQGVKTSLSTGNDRVPWTLCMRRWGPSFARRRLHMSVICVMLVLPYNTRARSVINMIEVRFGLRPNITSEGRLNLMGRSQNFIRRIQTLPSVIN